MSGSSDNSGRRVIDIIRGAVSVCPGLNINDPDCINSYGYDCKMATLLQEVGLQSYANVFENDDCFYEDLSQLTMEALKNLKVLDRSHQIKLLGGLEIFFQQLGNKYLKSVMSVVDKKCEEYTDIKVRMEKSCLPGYEYDIEMVEAICNSYLSDSYCDTQNRFKAKLGDKINEKTLFHGSLFSPVIAETGFEVALSSKNGFFGSGLYFTDLARKANRFVFGSGNDSKCAKHNDAFCQICLRKVLVCQVLCGRLLETCERSHYCHAPYGYEGVFGLPSLGGLDDPEYVVYENIQALPTYLISYRLRKTDEKEI